MKDGTPFCVAAIWDDWRDPKTGITTRAFAVVTCPANELVARDRMPVVIARSEYTR